VIRKFGTKQGTALTLIEKVERKATNAAFLSELQKKRD
jgi:hypothetical protein